MTRDGAYIAYQVVGDGPVDVAWLFDYTGNLDCYWEHFGQREWFEGLASFGRLILHDRRGTGLSSRDVPVPNLETRASDLRLVLDTVKSEQTVIGAYYEGLSPAVLLAASHPDRVRALVWGHPWPRATWAPDYPWGANPGQVEAERAMLARWASIEWVLAWADEQERANGFRPSEQKSDGRRAQPATPAPRTSPWRCQRCGGRPTYGECCRPSERRRCSYSMMRTPRPLRLPITSPR